LFANISRQWMVQSLELAVAADLERQPAHSLSHGHGIRVRCDNERE